MRKQRDIGGIRVAEIGDLQSSGGHRDVGGVCGAEGDIQGTQLAVFGLQADVSVMRLLIFE